MSVTGWKDEVLDAARQRGDEEADRLIAGFYQADSESNDRFGRLGYNRLLRLADCLVEQPELAFVEDSEVGKVLSSMPVEIVSFFKPVEAPEWLAPSRIERASELWRNHSLLMMAVLYAASLPYCYLMKNGVPALFQTQKLRNPRYLSQRLFETGLMLESVMGRGGFRVLHDDSSDLESQVLEALKEKDREGEWAYHGHGLKRQGPTELPKGLSPEEIVGDLGAGMLTGRGRRFVWGKGYVNARKVRLLHASMRYMLLHPDRFSSKDGESQGAGERRLRDVYAERDQPWDTEKLGVPVNQEDLAYTLLTFGYVIPKAAEKWGLHLSRSDREAFLHLWRLVGWCLGIEEGLMTDDRDHAEALFHQIFRRQKGASDDGKALAESLVDWLEGCLPKHFRMERPLGTMLIVDQLGEDATLLFKQPTLKAAGRIPVRLLYGVGRNFLWLHNRWSQTILQRIPLISPFVRKGLHQASEELLASLKSVYRRRPFFLPKDAAHWEIRYGADEALREKVVRWRRRLFNVLALGSAAIVMVSLSSLCLGVTALVGSWQAVWISLTVTLVLLAAHLTIVHVTIPRVVSNRPTVSDRSVDFGP